METRDKITDKLQSPVDRRGFVKTIAARQRNSAPGTWAPLLIQLAMREGLLTRIEELADL